MQNPQNFSVSTSNEFQTLNVPGKAGAKHVYTNTSNKSISFPGIIFDTFALGKELSLVLDEIETLMLPVEGKENPPLVGFSWGLTNYFPCYIIEFSYNVDLLLNGAPARLSADLTLEMTDEKQEISVDLSSVNQPDTVLTEREQIDALDLVNTDIQNNPTILGNFQNYSQYLSGLLNIEIDDTGVVESVFEQIRTRLGVYDSLDNAVIYD